MRICGRKTVCVGASMQYEGFKYKTYSVETFLLAGESIKRVMGGWALRAKIVAQFLLDLLFPRRCQWCDAVVGFACECRCAKALLEARRLAVPIKDFRIENWVLVEVYAPFGYVQPVRDAVTRLKFEGQRQLAAPLAAEMAVLMEETGLAQRYDILVPAPVSRETAKTRGYNQSALLAHEVASATGLPCREDLLEKVRETEPQRSLPREKRLHNVRDAYHGGEGLLGKRVLLVDDIVTTGSTLNECAKAVLAAGASACGALCLCATGHGTQEEETYSSTT